MLTLTLALTLTLPLVIRATYGGWVLTLTLTLTLVVLLMGELFTDTLTKTEASATREPHINQNGGERNARASVLVNVSVKAKPFTYLKGVPSSDAP